MNIISIIVHVTNVIIAIFREPNFMSLIVAQNMHRQIKSPTSQLVPLKYHPHISPTPITNPITSNTRILAFPRTIGTPHLSHRILIKYKNYAQQTITPNTPNSIANSKQPSDIMVVLLPKMTMMAHKNTIVQ